MDFDLFVIGGGSGGVRAARMAAARGARVALAEGGALGGTCVNVGCIPKKLYGYAAGFAEAFADAPGHGWSLPGAASLDWAALQAGRRREITRLNTVYGRLLADAGVQLFNGWARLDGPQAVVVGQARHTSHHVLVASGGRPRLPDMPGAQWGVTSDEMFDLPRLPRRLLVIGGGYIACEFASIFSGLGSEVTLAHRGERLLAGFDAETAGFLTGQMAEAGVQIRLQSRVESLQREQDLTLARLSDGSVLAADTVLHAIGRVPRTAGLGLESAGVRLDAHGAIAVDELHRSSAPGVHAVGDVSSRMHLTPVALAEAMVVVDQLFGDGRRRLARDHIPTAIFTHPQLASCGLAESEAAARFGRGELDVYASSFKPLRHALSGRPARSFMKLLVHRASDRVVGLHMVGDDAAEIVQGFAVAMNAGATKAHFDATLGIHPTVAEEFVTMRVPRPAP